MVTKHMYSKHMYSIYIYKSLLVNVSVSLIVSEVLPHMTVAGCLRPRMVM